MLNNSVTLKRNIIIICTLSLASFITACNGDSKKSPNPREKVITEIRKSIVTTMQADKTPGMAVALIHKDKTVFSEGFGVTNVESQQAVTADTSFWLGSVSKTAIAISIMHAQEKELLNLNDNVNQLLSNQGEVSLSTPFAEPILLKHLVNHTSSIVDSDAYDCAYFVGEENGEHANLLNQLLGGNKCDETVPVSFVGFLNAYLSEEGSYYSSEDNFQNINPGTKFEYSNIGAALAGFALEAATGTSLADYAKTHIFDPLKMGNTSWRLDDLNQSNIATPYSWDEDDQVMVDLPIYSLSTWPDGGLRSSANDLAKYLLMVSNGGKIGNTRILNSESINKMIPSDPTINDETTGVFWTKLKLSNGRVLIGHGGSDPGAYTYIFYDPAKNVGIVLVANGDDEIDDGWFARHQVLMDTLLDHAQSL